MQASTLGALEALLEFLRTPDVSIAVSGINIGPVSGPLAETMSFDKFAAISSGSRLVLQQAWQAAAHDPAGGQATDAVKGWD